ncbi:MAG: hypothetical protein JWP83_155 [Mycobacterium sp.]|jgi:hypothetical protein|nr:hypothetical protein [Mycobacterium sp.]
MRCKQNDYIRRAHTSGLCTTHYRRLRSGRDMDAPIRRYVRHQQGAHRDYEAASIESVRPKRKKPFEAEYALLAELGLGRN